MRRFLIIFAIFCTVSFANVVQAQMSSSNYQIQWDSFSSGGSETSASSSFQLKDSISTNGLGNSSSTSFQMKSGVRAGVFDEILNFSIFAQDRSILNAVTSVSSTNINLTSTTGFASGNYLVLIQDLGANQVGAIGKIVSIVTNTSITVDFWSTNGTMPVIDGTNDVVSPLTASALSLGSLSLSSVTTGIYAFEVNADLPLGYTIQVFSDGDLRSGSNTIDAISDGIVSVGSEEYGARSSDLSLSSSTFDSSDSAFTQSSQEIVSKSSKSFSDRAFLTLKASMNSSAANASYSQELSYVISGNF